MALPRGRESLPRITWFRQLRMVAASRAGARVQVPDGVTRRCPYEASAAPQPGRFVPASLRSSWCHYPMSETGGADRGILQTHREGPQWLIRLQARTATTEKEIGAFGIV